MLIWGQNYFSLRGINFTKTSAENLVLITLAQVSVIPQASDFFRSLHNSHLCLHFNITSILFMRSLSCKKIVHSFSRSCKNLFTWHIFQCARIFRHLYNMGGKSSTQRERFFTRLCRFRSLLFTFVTKL